MKAFKQGMMSAGDATARGAKRAKLNAEIMSLQNKVGSVKKDFGTYVYAAMAASNQAEVDRLFGETRAKVDALEAEIAGKRAQVADLKEPRSSSAGMESPRGGPPPPGMPPPAGPPPPPPGWKMTTTAEGKEYYYNESTGETSWTRPVPEVS